jgi:hypothetical protein
MRPEMFGRDIPRQGMSPIPGGPPPRPGGVPYLTPEQLDAIMGPYINQDERLRPRRGIDI